MKTLLLNAQNTHRINTGEIVTDIAVAATLWPESRLNTQRQNLYNLTTGRTTLNVSHITALIGLFPETDGNYWMGL